MIIQRLFKRLRTVKDGSVDLALAAALPTAGPTRRREIALLLLARRHPAGAAALVIHHDLLPLDLRQTIAADAANLGPVLRAAGRMRDVAGCDRVVRLIRDAGAIGLADILAEQLRAPSIATRELAALALFELANGLGHRAAADPVKPRDLAMLHAAVEDAVVQYRHHHQRATLLAMAALLPRRCPKALAVIEDPRQPVLAALRQMILEGREPALLRHLLTWMTMPDLAQASLGALLRIRHTPRLGQVLTGGHQLLLGRVRQALARTPQPEQLVPTDEELIALPAAAQRHLPAWVMALPLPRELKAESLARIAAVGDPITRLASLRQLIALSTTAATPPIPPPRR